MILPDLRRYISRDRLAEEEHALEIGIHDTVIGFRLDVEQSLPAVDARHVEQNVDLAVTLHDLVYAAVNAVQIGYIESVRRRRAAMRGDLVCQLPAFLLVSRTERRLSARRRESAADRAPDAAGRAGDQDGLSFQTEYGFQIFADAHDAASLSVEKIMLAFFPFFPYHHD